MTDSEQNLRGEGIHHPQCGTLSVILTFKVHTPSHPPLMSNRDRMIYSGETKNYLQKLEKK